jgi:xylose isomerase
VQFSPELVPASDLSAATRALIADGARFIHVYWHSPSHVKGSHFMATDRDVDELWRRLDAILDTAHRHADVRFGTVADVAASLAGPR